MTKKEVLKFVANKHGITINWLTWVNQNRASAKARKEAAYMLRQIGMSYPSIAKILGYKEHSAAMYAVKTHGFLKTVTKNAANKLLELKADETYLSLQHRLFRLPSHMSL